MTKEKMLDVTVARHNYDWLVADAETLALLEDMKLNSEDHRLVCCWYMNTLNGRGLIWC